VKEQFIPKYFGEQYVCNIGSYNTYGLKSALLDMTRIFSGDRGEILKITTQLGLKDEDGDVLTWEKAVDMYPELKAWASSCLEHRKKPVIGCEECEKQVQIANSVKRLLAADIDWEKYDYKEPPHRNKSMGVHAAGVIISSKKIEELIPLVRGRDGQRVSAFGEGMHSQDLSWVGLVKLDSLGLEALNKIAVCLKLIRQRYPNVKKICSVGDDSPSWSDPTYLNDPKCLATANSGDLKMIFQFDSEGIRSLARKGGVTSFDDLVAYTALYRPGPMGCGMHEQFIKRKRGGAS
jgi:DNA polymerase III alpha subunit